jgi:hypothetical protein
MFRTQELAIGQAHPVTLPNKNQNWGDEENERTENPEIRGCVSQTSQTSARAPQALPTSGTEATSSLCSAPDCVQKDGRTLPSMRREIEWKGFCCGSRAFSQSRREIRYREFSSGAWAVQWFPMVLFSRRVQMDSAHGCLGTKADRGSNTSGKVHSSQIP